MADDEPPSVSQIFNEIDAEMASKSDGAGPIRPVSFRRLAPKPGQQASVPMTMSADGPSPSPVDYSNLPYPQWLRAVESKYRLAMTVRSAPDFIDIDLLNTVMAEYPGTYIEIAREAREAQDAADDAKEVFDLWWDGKVEEARSQATQEGRKITSDSGLKAYARSIFGRDYTEKSEGMKVLVRKAEFLGTLKMVVQNSATVLRALGQSVAFEWSTSGGLKFNEAGKTYFGLPARRIGERPSQQAMHEAFKRRSSSQPQG